MLLKYGAKNYFSFKEGFEVSFELGKNCPLPVKSYSNILCINGANGSGKTNVLKTLSFFKDFCCNSWNEKPESLIYISSFFHNSKPIDFFIEFNISNIKYRYEASLTTKKIISEIIYKKIKRETKIIERTNNEITYCNSKYKELEKIKLRANASIISTANQYEILQIKPIYNFFNSIITNVYSLIGLNDYEPDINVISEYYLKYKKMFEFTKKIICNCDLGISDITIEQTTNEKGKDIYYPLFHYNINNKITFLLLHSQSSGTKTLFYRLANYKYALDTGGVIVADEFDIHLHPHILPVLFDLFVNEDINKKNAQLIFTTHNTEIMDFLGKYRTLLINKENNESFCYRLDELPGDIIRNDRPISPIYNSGKIGGVPKI